MATIQSRDATSRDLLGKYVAVNEVIWVLVLFFLAWTWPERTEQNILLALVNAVVEMRPEAPGASTNRIDLSRNLSLAKTADPHAAG